MDRPNWHFTHMKQAELMAERSTCVKLKVGAVLVRDHRTISQGYNGVGPNCRHCADYWYDMFRFYDHFQIKDVAPEECKTFDQFLHTEYFRTEHKRWSIEHELHAEQNCILWAAREGIATKDAILYCIYSPCINCAKVIHMAGIKEVYYQKIYESDKTGMCYLTENNILCKQV